MTEPPPRTRRSSNGKDAAHTSAETRVRPPARRSNPKSLYVRAVPLTAVSALIEEHHYLHSVPAAASAAFGIYLGGDLVGAAVITVGSMRAHRLLQGGRPGDVVTLSRLWLHDSLGRNSESRILSILVRILRRTKQWKLLVTFADPAAGHTGTIYRAAGFLYLGQTLPELYFEFGDGEIRHPRSVGTRYGSNNIGHLARTGVRTRRVAMPAKHDTRSCSIPHGRGALRRLLGPIRGTGAHQLRGRHGSAP